MDNIFQGFTVNTSWPRGRNYKDAALVFHRPETTAAGVTSSAPLFQASVPPAARRELSHHPVTAQGSKTSSERQEAIHS